MLTARQIIQREMYEWKNVDKRVWISRLIAWHWPLWLVNKQQIALFNSRRLNEVFAVSNFDPIGEANVLSRGIIGSIGDEVVVASPLYKQHFNLRTGECLEKPEHTISVYPVRVEDGLVQVHI